MNETIIVFDLETTGRSPQFDRITEIGAYNMSTGEKFSTFVNPEKKIPKDVQELTHITDEMVAEAPSQREAIQAFLEFAGENPIYAGHNLPFDIRFIAATLDRLGFEIPEIRYIDTLPISKHLHPDWAHHKLGNLCEYYEIENQAAHRAYEDAEATAKVLSCLQEEADYYLPEEEKISLFEPKLAEIKVEQATERQMAYIRSLMDQLDIDEPYPTALSKGTASKKIGELIALKEKLEASSSVIAR